MAQSNRSNQSRDKDDKRRMVENAAIGGAVTDTVQRHGSAVKGYEVAYSGVDNETGEVLKRSLKSTAESKVNPKFEQQNISQQGGFSAEVATAAEENAESCIKGEYPGTVRTDDMRPQTAKDGRIIGGMNDPLEDLAKVDKNGNYIEGTARQLKYVGKNPHDCCQKLLGKGSDKYRQAGVPLEVPKDFYDEVQKELSRHIDKTAGQLERAEQSGNTSLARKRREQLERLKQTKELLRPGKLTKDEATFARKNPKLHTAKKIAGVAHRSGLEGAKIGAAVGGGISVIRNAVAVYKGEKEMGEAAADVLKDTATAAGTGYVTGAAGAVVKGVMQNSKTAMIRTLSKSSLPGNIAIVVLEAGKTFYRFANGEIDGTQCFAELGEKGAGLMAGSIGAGIGQAVIPIPIVGAMIGSMCGYTLSSIWYSGLRASLQEAKLAHEERLQIEAECRETIRALREYRIEMERLIQAYFRQHTQAFALAFSEMHEAFQTGDVDLMIGGANRITEDLGKESLFRDMDEFEERMSDSRTIRF